VIRSKQQLCALRPIGDAMGLSTMLFGDEVLSPDRLDELDGLADAEATKRELTMAQQLIDSLSADFDPTKFKDEYREQVLNLIERKANGEEIAVAPQAEDDTPVPDLMAALEASLAEVRSGDSDQPSGAKKKSAPAKPASKRAKAKT
jgi:DNA end-binding protein Ku